MFQTKTNKPGGQHFPLFELFAVSMSSQIACSEAIDISELRPENKISSRNPEKLAKNIPLNPQRQSLQHNR